MTMGIVDVARPAASGAGAAPATMTSTLSRTSSSTRAGESVGSFPVPSALDDDVLAVDVPQFTHPLEESLPGAPTPRAGRRGTPEKASPIEFPGLLRLGRERRNDEAEHENKREPDQPHGHLGEDGWRESSRPELLAACPEESAALVEHALFEHLVRKY